MTAERRGVPTTAATCQATSAPTPTATSTRDHRDVVADIPRGSPARPLKLAANASGAGARVRDAPGREPNVFVPTLRPPDGELRGMPATTLDLRDVPPAERHPKIHDAFAELDSGETLRIVNDHEPKPLFYEFQAEVESFDADNYAVERRGVEEYVADLPKR